LVAFAQARLGLQTYLLALDSLLVLRATQMSGRHVRARKLESADDEATYARLELSRAFRAPWLSLFCPSMSADAATVAGIAAAIHLLCLVRHRVARHVPVELWRQVVIQAFRIRTPEGSEIECVRDYRYTHGAPLGLPTIATFELRHISPELLALLPFRGDMDALLVAVRYPSEAAGAV
jgi:hypothetical protein